MMMRSVLRAGAGLAVMELPGVLDAGAAGVGAVAVEVAGAAGVEVAALGWLCLAISSPSGSWAGAEGLGLRLGGRSVWLLASRSRSWISASSGSTGLEG